MRYALRAVAALLVLGLSSPFSLAASAVALGVHDGIYTVAVQINRSVTLECLIDTGSSVVVIPESVLNTLVREGSVTREDVLGTGTAITADRTMYQSAQIRLREVRLGDIVVRDVMASVSPALIAPLLGQSFLSRFPLVTFDNQRHVMILSGSAPGTYSQPASPYGTQ